MGSENIPLARQLAAQSVIEGKVKHGIAHYDVFEAFIMKLASNFQ